MRSKLWLTAATILLLGTSSTSLGQLAPSSVASLRMHNSDVLLMVKRGVTPQAIIARIATSHCNFDIFPPVLEDLRRRGVPDAVLQMMVMAPNGPPDLQAPSNTYDELLPRTVRVKVPRGTEILVETLYPVSSADVKKGSSITFSVVNPVYHNGVMIIGRGAVAKARVVRAKKAQSWGRPGSLYWEMDHVVALDGSRIPVILFQSSKGDNRASHLAAGAAVTTALVFPYTAPVALVWGFKKGEDAVLRGSKQFYAILRQDIEVTGLLPEKDRIIYHYAEALKAKTVGVQPASFPRHSVKGSFK